MSHDKNRTSQNGPLQSQVAASKVAAATVETIRDAGDVFTTKELQIVIDDLKKGQATKNKILDWLLASIQPHVMQHMKPLMFHLTDTCDERELGQCIDYLKLKMPNAADYVESYRDWMTGLVTARVRTAEIKQESLAELASQA